MSYVAQSWLLTAAILVLLGVLVGGDIHGWATWALIFAQLLVMVVQISIVRSGKVPS